MAAAMPVAYAVTYLYGTAGSAWFLASIGPKLLHTDLAKECAEYEAKMGGAMNEEAQLSAYRRLTTRAYQVAANSKWAGKTVREFEEQFTIPRVFVVRLRQKSKISEADPDVQIRAGDILDWPGRASCC